MIMAKKTIEIYGGTYQRIEEFAQRNYAAVEDVVDWLVEYLDDLQKELDKQEGFF